MFKEKILECPWEEFEKIIIKWDVGSKAICKIELIQKRPFVKSGRIVCQIAVKNIGETGADVDRFLAINTSAVNRLAVSDDVSKVEK
jgi:hypothetical protein